MEWDICIQFPLSNTIFEQISLLIRQESPLKQDVKPWYLLGLKMFFGDAIVFLIRIWWLSNCYHFPQRTFPHVTTLKWLFRFLERRILYNSLKDFTQAVWSLCSSYCTCFEKHQIIYQIIPYWEKLWLNPMTVIKNHHLGGIINFLHKKCSCCRICKGCFCLIIW